MRFLPPRILLPAFIALCLVSGKVVAQNNASDSFCILPIYDPLTSGVSDAALQTEMNKLKAQIGESRGYYKVGFSHIFGGATSGGNSARMAAANNLSVGFIIALQTHSVNSTTAAVAAKDLRLYQWRLDGVTWAGKYTTDTGGSQIYPARDYKVVSPSRYAAALQTSFKSQIQTTAGYIKTIMTNYPGTVAVVNGLIEEELATGDGTDAYLGDYSPFAVAEFRDWLRHTGIYDDSSGTFAGQGAPAAITGAFVTVNNVARSPFYSDPSPNALASGRSGKTFNATFGTNFTTWTAAYWDTTAYPNAITDTSFNPTPQTGATGYTAGGFDAPRTRNAANAFWNAWSWDYYDHGNTYPAGNPTTPAFGFRQVMVHHFVNDLLGWVVLAGIPKEVVYAHQIPGETAGAPRARTGADPMWCGVTDFNGHLGVTRFGSFPYDTALTYSQNWGIVEWHPQPGATANDPNLYTNTVNSVGSYYLNGAHALFPGWWENTNSATFLLTDSNFAIGLHDWLAAQPDVPPPGGQGVVGQYFANTTLTAPAALTRVDPAINFGWGGNSPGTGVPGTNFSVRWTGWVQPRYTETYTFYTTTDDASRLYLNGAQVIDNWTSPVLTEKSGTIDLVAGQFYPVTLEYYQTTGGAGATLSWSSASQTKQIVSPNQLYPALPVANWTKNATGTQTWAAAANWSGSVAPTSNTETALRFLGGTTAAAGTLTATNGTDGFKLNALQLSGTAASTAASTVALTGGALSFVAAASGGKPFVTLDAVKSASYGLNYTVANALTLGDYTTFLGNGTAGFALNGTITGTGGLRKQGTAALTLSGSNTFSGVPITVENGTLILGHLSALAGASAIYVQDGAQLATANTPAATGTFANVPLVLSGYGSGATSSGGALRFNRDGNTLTWPGGITLGSDSQITFFSSGGAYHFSAPITGAGSLTFRAGGAAANHYHTVLLDSSSTYSGSTLATSDAANITLQLGGGSDRLPTSTILTLAGDLYSGTACRGWLDLNGYNQTLSGLTAANTARGRGDDRVVNSASSTNATLTINSVVSTEFTGTIGGGTGDSRNNFNLLKTGAGTFTLSGANNTFTGYTQILAGTLALSTGTGSTSNLTGTATVDVESGGTLDVNAIGGFFALGSSQTLTGTGAVAGATTINGKHQPGVGGLGTFANGITYGATSHRLWQLFGNVTATAGTNFDQVAVTGAAVFNSGAVVDVILNGTGSQVDFTNAFWKTSRTWTLLTATSTSGTCALGSVSNDAAGNAATGYGAFSVVLNSTSLALVWTPIKPFGSWQYTNFGSNVGNTAVAGPTANPSGDGVTNLMKYALGLDPNKVAVAGLPATNIVNGHLQMQFSRNTAATDINYVVQASNDLAAWTTLATRAAGATGWTGSGATVTDNSGLVTVIDSTVTSTVGKRYLRLSVTLP